MFTTIVILPALMTLPTTGDSSTELQPLDPYSLSAASVIEPALYSTSSLYLPDDGPDADGKNNWYLRINAGMVSTSESDGPDEDIDYDEGWLLGIAIGKRLTDGTGAFDFDLELEGVWTDQDTDDDVDVADVTTIAPYLNGVFDFHLTDTFTLYGGAGIGAAWVDIGEGGDSLNDFDDEDGPFLSWQLKAGVMFALSRSTSLTFGYRFRNIDDVELEDELNNNSFDLETQQHILELGIVFGI